MAEIKYNNVITSLEAGKTATLACAGKKAKTDIVVVFGSDGTITYNGTETAVEAGKTATLACNGKKMKSDVVLWCAKGLATVTITSECNGMSGDTAHIKIVSETVIFEAYAYDMPNCTIEVPVGSTIECTVSRNKGNADSSISLNGTKVMTEGTYVYTVTGNVAVDVSDRYSMGEYGVITITEERS